MEQITQEVKDAKLYTIITNCYNSLKRGDGNYLNAIYWGNKNKFIPVPLQVALQSNEVFFIKKETEYSDKYINTTEGDFEAINNSNISLRYSNSPLQKISEITGMKSLLNSVEEKDLPQIARVLLDKFTPIISRKTNPALYEPDEAMDNFLCNCIIEFILKQILRDNLTTITDKKEDIADNIKALLDYVGKAYQEYVSGLISPETYSTIYSKYHIVAILKQFTIVDYITNSLLNEIGYTYKLNEINKELLSSDIDMLTTLRQKLLRTIEYNIIGSEEPLPFKIKLLKALLARDLNYTKYISILLRMNQTTFDNYLKHMNQLNTDNEIILSALIESKVKTISKFKRRELDIDDLMSRSMHSIEEQKLTLFKIAENISSSLAINMQKITNSVDNPVITNEIRYHNTDHQVLTRSVNLSKITDTATALRTASDLQQLQQLIHSELFDKESGQQAPSKLTRYGMLIYNQHMDKSEEELLTKKFCACKYIPDNQQLINKIIYTYSIYFNRRLPIPKNKKEQPCEHCIATIKFEYTLDANQNQNLNSVVYTEETVELEVLSTRNLSKALWRSNSNG